MSAHYGPGVVDTRNRWWRAAASATLATVDLATLALVLCGVHGGLRFTLGLIVGVVVPGWTVVGPIGLSPVALVLGLSVAVSLATLMLAAQVMMTLGAWHPVALEEVTCMVCLPSLVWQSRHLRTRLVKR
ncbi:MAG TPA: hypothetical protein VMV53_11490 [Acidimicrobiales bacterium]|nr:hypothetical protein [Acidimicrobiales bacterium]